MAGAELPSLDGVAFARGEAGYEEARRAALANARRPARGPELIVRARGAADVAAAVRLAAERGWRLDVRSGGHSWSGSHLHGDGLLIDLSEMTGYEIDAESGRAWAEPGLRSSELSARLAERDLLFPTGHCIGPALGGFLLQGGFGWHSRTLGPACMSVLAVEAVTAAGEIVRASAEENADLFWAARGAGPGFPAIVTRFHLELAPRPPVQLASTYLFAIEELEPLMRWAHEVSPSVPRSIELMVFLRRGLGEIEGPGLQLLAPVLAETEEQALADLAVVESCPLLDRALFADPRRPTDVGELVAGSADFYPEGHRYAVDNMWTSAPVEELLPFYRQVAATVPDSPSHMMWMNWAPPAGERPDMAYSLEDQVYIALYGIWPDSADNARFEDWATARMRESEAVASGIQLADENLARRPAPFLSPESAARLERVRDRWDPDRRIHAYLTDPPTYE
jgi:FAD/FMN-containing dehydrogenase